MSERDTYFRKARSWAEDDRAGTARSRKTAWTIAGIAVSAAAFEAVAIAMLVPLKTVQPITLLVDRQTGYVQALDPVSPQRVTADAALTYAYVAQYVAAREGFDRATVQMDYRRVGLWSAGRARSSYLSVMAPGNSASPLRAYPAGTQISVRVKSVSRLQPGVGLVHFDTQRVDRNGQADAPRPWMAVVRYRYSSAPMAFADRLVNPLGFQVTGYRRDAEAPAVIIDDPSQVSARDRLSSMGPPIANTASSESLRIEAPSEFRRQKRVSAQPTVRSPNPMRREVPMNQIPLGSPLASNSGAQIVTVRP